MTDPVERALWFIESRFEGELSADDVARAAGVSRFHLSRLFALVIGQPMSAYVRGRRLSEAARALAGGAPDILVVALTAGYGLSRSVHPRLPRTFRRHARKRARARLSRRT
jgi:AraC family transcriptional regulator